MWYERGVEGGTGTLIEPQRQPGIMIFNWKAETFYQNQEALEIMGALAGKDPAFSPAPGSSLPRIIVEIYTEFKTWEARNQDQAEGMIRFDIREYDLDGALYQLLPVLMQPQWNESRATQLLILIERVFKKPGLTRREKSIRLTPRERSVVQLLSEGMTNKEVANDLHIGEYTVKGYIKQIMKKLNVTTRAAIVAKSFSNSRDLNFGSTGDRPRAGDPPVPKSA
jgi:DNA-binding CsgD family transcriptional regulator